VDLRAVDRFEAVPFALVFLVVDLRLLDFFAEAPFFGMRAPDSRASFKAIAMACFGFETFLRPPDRSS